MSGIGVYFIRHASGLFYIGSTGNISMRKSGHKHDLMRGRHKNAKLQQAFLTNPNIIFEFYPTTTREEAYALEDEWIRNSWGNPLLANLVPYARLQPGMAPQEVIDRLRAVNRGKVVSKETRNKISTANKGMVRQDSTKVLMSSQRRGVSKSPDWSDKIAEAKRIKVVVDGVEYPSATAVTLVYGCSIPTVMNRCRSEKFPNWKIV